MPALPMSLTPHIAGFDMPGAAQDPDHYAVLDALLSEAPGPAWQEALHEQADAFCVRQGIAQLRLIGNHLHLVGPVGRLRVSAAAVQALVAEVGRTVQARRATSADPDATAEQALAQRETAARPDPREAEVAAVAAVPGIQAILAEVCAVTGMRFSAVARVTDQRWTTCAVLDGLEFGLQPGQDLVLETTVCRELRPGQTTSFGKASAHPVFSAHPAPRIYGFESHLSIPLVLADGSLFGSLCALDPRPATLDAAVMQKVEALAASIAAQLKLEAASAA